MTTNEQTKTEFSLSLQHLEAAYEGLVLVINNLGLEEGVKETVLAELKTALGGKDELAQQIRKVGMDSFRAGGNLPVEMAFAAKSQALCDVLYRICSLAKIDTTLENLLKLDQALKALFEGAPPPHVIKTMEGEIKALKKANERLKGLVEGNDPVQLMDEGEKFETLRDVVVQEMAKTNVQLKAESASRAEEVIRLKEQVKNLKANLYDLKDGMMKLQGAQRMEIIASLKEVLGLVEGGRDEGDPDPKAA